MTEPTTTLTDYVLSLFAFIFASILLRQSWAQKQRSIRLWAIAFDWVGLAAGLGGTCHGFVEPLGAHLTQGFWTGMIYALTCASLALLWGTVLSTVPPPWQRWLLLIALVKTSLLWFSLRPASIVFPSFTLAACDYGLALGLALLLYGAVFLGGNSLGGNRSAGWMVAGILTSGLALGVLGSQFSFTTDLNPNDLYHLIQLVGLGLLFQGARRLRDC